jgi:Na+-translocating ferredoxin:NAD+ oxidoreductase RnfG subunit
MNEAKRNTIISIVVLSLITLVATTLLVVFNAILPGSPPPGLDDILPHLETIMPGSTFVQHDYDIEAFNQEYGSANIRVTMVVKASGGKHEGNYAVRLSTNGFGSNPAIDALVGYDSDSAIIGVATVNNPETSPAGNTYLRPGFNDAFVSQGTDPSRPIIVNDLPNDVWSGATASINAYVAGVNLATRLATILNETVIVPTWQEATAAENAILRNLVNDNTALFSRANIDLLDDLDILARANAKGLVAVYIQRNGEYANKRVIIESEGDSKNIQTNYIGGNISTMSVFVGEDSNAKIERLAIGTINNSSVGRPNGAIDFNDLVPQLALIAPTLTRVDWFRGGDSWDNADNIFDLDTGATSGGNSGLGSSMLGFVLSVRHGFGLHDSLDYDALMSAVSQTPVPQPTWGGVTVNQRDLLRDMMGQWTYKDVQVPVVDEDGDPVLDAEGESTYTTESVKDIWVPNTTLDFASADNSMMAWYQLISDVLDNQATVFVSSEQHLIYKVDATTTVDQVSSTHNAYVRLGYNKDNPAEYLVSQIRMGDNSLNATVLSALNSSLQYIFEAASLVDIRDLMPEDIRRAPTFVDNNAITDTMLSNIIESVKVAFELNYQLNRDQEALQEFVNQAIKPRWLNVDDDTLSKLRYMTGTIDSVSGELVPSTADFANASAQMLESIGAIGLPNRPTQAQIDEYNRLKSTIVGAYVAQDGTGRIVLECYADQSRNPELGSNGSNNHNGRVSMLVMLQGIKDNRVVASTRLGSILNMSGGRDQYESFTNMVNKLLVGLNRVQIQRFLGVDSNGLLQPGDLTSGATYGVNGALSAVFNAFDIDLMLDGNILRNATPRNRV